jgi:hypothetical protein
MQNVPHTCSLENARKSKAFAGSVLCGIFFCTSSMGEPPKLPAVIQNDELSIVLSTDKSGMPCLAQVAWKGAPAAIETQDAPVVDWLPETLSPDPRQPLTWSVTADTQFKRAEARLHLKSKLVATWVVELAASGTMIRLRLNLTNPATNPVAVVWFPVWNAAWKMPGYTERIRWWDALSFVPREKDLTLGKRVDLHSRVHSSDDIDGGVNPYWQLSGKSGAAYFSLDWCGGWQTEIHPVADGINLRVFLPEDETRLVLQPGESVTGPALEVFLTRADSDAARRTEWMRQRARLARAAYGGPAPSFPFSWNHWYTVRFKFDAPFLQRQVESFAPYGFDYFIVDAGWYEACGKWRPDPKKFQPGEFERRLGEVRAEGVKIGLWTCPQFVKAAEDALPPEVDRPVFFRKFIDGYLLDMAGMDFSKHLTNHVAKLRHDYQMNWWKYDQDFFTTNATRAGRMKNVIALQQALLAVRKSNPDLFMENCQSGGRMINERTVGMTQSQWIRDGSRTGLRHARSNWMEALGALEFLPPWTVGRWTNRPDENDPNDDELTRMYCRSAMAGTWGLVADLSKIGSRQRAIIVQEVANYRRLNEIKADCVYDIYAPTSGAPAAGVVYYNAEGSRAAILLMRWNNQGAFTFPVQLSALKVKTDYRIERTDGFPNKPLKVEGAERTIAVNFSAEQQSALIFIGAGK